MTLSDQLFLVPAGGFECRTASAADCSCRRHRRRRRRRRRHNDVTEKSHATVFCSQQLLRNKITTVLFFYFSKLFLLQTFLCRRGFPSVSIRQRFNFIRWRSSHWAQLISVLALLLFKVLLISQTKTNAWELPFLSSALQPNETNVCVNRWESDVVSQRPTVAKSPSTWSWVGSSIATECLLDVEGKVCDEGSYERPLAHPRALSRGARFRPRESEQWRFCCSLGSCEVVGQAAELQINDPGSNPAINLLQDKARNLIGL